jgi:hypothetical protein
MVAVAPSTVIILRTHFLRTEFITITYPDLQDVKWPLAVLLVVIRSYIEMRPAIEIHASVSSLFLHSDNLETCCSVTTLALMLEKRMKGNCFRF